MKTKIFLTILCCILLVSLIGMLISQGVQAQGSTAWPERLEPLTERIVIFTSSGTFTAPPGVTTVYLTMCGGGGGGGGGTYNAGAGGGGASGNTIVNYPYTVIPGGEYTVTIGEGGSGGEGGFTAGEGEVGGNSVFDTLTVPGGDYGEGGGGGYYGGGGSNSKATLGISVEGDPGNQGGADRIGGLGGNGILGSGGAGGDLSAGGTGSGYSGGGGGGASRGNFWYDGGAGAAGVCIIMY